MSRANRQGPAHVALGPSRFRGRWTIRKRAYPRLSDSFADPALQPPQHRRRIRSERPPRMADLARRLRQPRHDVLHHHPFDLGDRPARLEMRVAEDIAHVEDRRDRRVDAAEFADDLVHRPGRDPGAEMLLQGLAVGGAVLEAGEAPIAGEADEIQQPCGDAVGRGGDGDPFPVGAAIGAARHGIGDARAQPRLDVAQMREGGDQRPHDLEHGVQKADVDHLALAGLLGMAERGEDAEGAHQGRHLVGQRDGRQQRSALGLAEQSREAAEGLGDGGEAGMLGIGPVLAEAAHPQDDELRIRPQQILAAETQGLELSRPHVLDQHIRLGQKRPKARPAGVGFQIQGDRELVAVEELPEIGIGLARPRPAHAPGRIAARRLDLDDLRPEIGEIFARPGAGDDGRQLDHANAGERSSRSFGISFLPPAGRAAGPSG